MLPLDMGSDLGADSLDLARDLAGLMFRTARTVGQDLLDAAGELEPLLGDKGRVPQRSSGESVAGSAPAALALTDAAAGTTTSKEFLVRNDSLETLDALGLRCAGMFAAGGMRISSANIKFSPVTVDVLPRETANVSCKVHVPKATKRGHYVGLIEAVGLDDVQLLVTLDVL
jgi:hypothetical protein